MMFSDNGDFIVYDGQPRLNEYGDMIGMYRCSELMQFTGLYDKNNVPIYEGDIVTHSTLRGNGFGGSEITELILGPVIFVNGTYLVESVLDTRDGPITPTLSSIISSFIPEKYSCEIVGNIHQTPELLEGT